MLQKSTGFTVIPFLILSFCCTGENQKPSGNSGECVVLVHGFMRSSRQLRPLGNYLSANGYEVIYADYPSRRYNIQEISKRYILPQVKNGCHNGKKKVHFITHSAGSIVVRYFLSKNTIPNPGRVVMLAPPNRGSEVADFLSQYSVLNFVFGPVLFQLRANKESFVNGLPPPDYEFGVIAGNSTNDPFSSRIIPGDDDGKVSIEKTKLKNMKDFLLVNRTHTFIMDAPEVRWAITHFIRKGSFR